MNARNQLSFALLGLLSVSHVCSYLITSPNTLLVEFGTYNSSNRICFDKIILKAAQSPVLFNFNNPTDTPITYIKVEQIQQRRGGISADIVGGLLGSPSVTLQVSAFQGKLYFYNDVRVEMMCTPQITTTTVPPGTTSTVASTSTVANTTPTPAATSTTAAITTTTTTPATTTTTTQATTTTTTQATTTTTNGTPVVAEGK
ncbi:uncharacterized protein LOC129769074 [Toxorhynchites rutilus septentrionalis]|uniref:uncharacterized protein LOC129769074 n=1 Tax=Toxorhynchites rutilus septentrionalis TaxID=329112 RepID=UPI0024793652|nr:uncharacterized protein LOC129769074 [Toxorhynchites rutilus septentrionalis]